MAQFAHLIQQNLNRGKTCSPDLYLHIQEKLATGVGVIAALQEPQVNENTITVFPDRNLIYCRNPDLCSKNAEGGRLPPRAALFVSNGLYVSPLPTFTNGDMATALWATKDDRFKHILISSIYMDGKLPITPLFERVIKYCKRKRLPYIFLIDSNAHTPLWGELKTDQKGAVMEGHIINNAMTILNRGRRPFVFTWKRNEFESIIDISLCSQELESFMQNWKCQYREICDSDHCTISIDFQVDVMHYTFVRNYKRPGWAKFSSMMEKKSRVQIPDPPLEIESMPTPNTGDMWTQTRLEEEAESFTNDIIACLDITHPLKKVPITLPDLKWFDDEVAKAKSEKHSSHNIWRKARTEENYQQYHECLKNYRKMISKAKRVSWRSVVDNIHDFESVAKFNKILNRKNLNGLGQLIDQDGQPTSTISESLDILLRAHFPDCSDSAIHHWEPDGSLEVDINDEAYEYYSMEKLVLAIESFGEHKAAGMDGIQPIVLQALGAKAYARLLKLYKASIALAYVPKCWRESKVIFIPKPGKSDYSDPRSFRPISLMSFILKGLERIVLYQMQETTFVENPQHMNQHAFRKGRSCESALTNMVEYLESAIIKKQFAVAVFLDVKGAFDHVQTVDIIKGLNDKNTPPSIVKWYEFCLKHRKIFMEHKGETVTKFPVRGTPQGGVLSPIMWNLAFESLLDLFPDSGRVKIVGYADDAALVCSGPNHDYIVHLLQQAIDKVLKWGTKHGLTFEPKKTKAVTFTMKKVKLPSLKKVKISGHSIDYDTSAKYLGIHLDYRLNWQTHLTRRLNKAKALLHKVRQAAGKLWGLNPRMSIWFYRAIVRPMFCYGALVWARIVACITACRKIRRLQRLALMSMGNFYGSTPTAGLEVITYTTPLTIHIRQEAAMAYLRTKHLVKLDRQKLFIANSPLKTGHRQFIESFLVEIGFVDNLSDEIPLRYNWNQPYTIDISSFDKGDPDELGDFTVYTDGSKNNKNQVGAGLVIYEGSRTPYEEHWHLGENLTVYQSELYAINKAIESLINQAVAYDRLSIIIYTDSRSSLQALQSKTITSRQLQNLVNNLTLLGMRHDVTLRWIKAHVGHSGNEKADELAKLGADTIDRRPDDLPEFSNKAIRKALRERVVEFWDQMWINNDPHLCDYPCRQTKHFFPEIARKRSVLLTSCSRKVFTEAVHIVTGHNFFNRHQHLVHAGTGGENEVYPMCRYCDEEEETSYHLVADCPQFVSIRREIFLTHQLTLPFDFSPVKLFKYIEKAKWQVFAPLVPPSPSQMAPATQLDEADPPRRV